MTYTIEAVGLTKSFRGTPVLTGLDLRVRPGELVALLGPNGAGKTTAVRILTTLLPADGGTARVAGLDVATDGHRVRRAISVTGQHVALDDVLTGRENLLVVARLRRLSRRAARARADELLERFGLTAAQHRAVRTWSGGMRRRLDIAICLITDPQVVFLDEPTAGLDPRSRRDVWDTVARLRDAGVTILLTTQYLEEADQLAGRVVVLHGGRVVAEGTPDELKARVGGETVVLHLPDAPALAGAAAVWAHRGRVDEAGLAVHVPTDGSAAAVRALLDEAGTRGIAVDRVSLHRPRSTTSSCG